MELKAKVGDKVFITQVTNTEVIIYQLYKKHHIYEVIRIFNDAVDNKDYVIINDETGTPCILFEEDYEVIENFNSVINGTTSDSYHTFNELYHHRMVLFSVICNTFKSRAWKSKLHDDGTMFDDYFIVGIDTPEGMFTYHYHLDNWDYFNVRELKNAPKWDGHTSDDISRLLSI